MPDPEISAQPTPYPDVNAALALLLVPVRDILRDALVGMYLYGSLAQGDFSHASSDIDIIVVTERAVSDEQFARLQALHATFRASDSPWADKVEVAYIRQGALNLSGDDSSRYPQLETDRDLAWEPLEQGWPFQRSVLREQGIVIAGPEPKSLLAPVAAQELTDAALAIVRLWREQARTDPTWLDWVRERSAQRFVLLTLARSLYTLANGTLASKAQAARWAQSTLDGRWAALVARSVAHHADEMVTEQELADTMTFIEFTVECLAASATGKQQRSRPVTDPPAWGGDPHDRSPGRRAGR